MGRVVVVNLARYLHCFLACKGKWVTEKWMRGGRRLAALRFGTAHICNFHQASRSSERGAPHHTVIDPHQFYLNSSLIKIWAVLERQLSQERVYLASMNLSLISRTPMKVTGGL